MCIRDRATGDLFIALGRGQSPRGIKKRGLRPNYIAVDDIDDDELVRNPRRVGEAVDWLIWSSIRRAVRMPPLPCRRP